MIRRRYSWGDFGEEYVRRVNSIYEVFKVEISLVGVKYRKKVSVWLDRGG